MYPSPGALVAMGDGGAAHIHAGELIVQNASHARIPWLQQGSPFMISTSSSSPLLRLRTPGISHVNVIRVPVSTPNGMRNPFHSAFEVLDRQLDAFPRGVDLHALKANAAPQGIVHLHALKGEELAAQSVTLGAELDRNANSSAILFPHRRRSIHALFDSSRVEKPPSVPRTGNAAPFPKPLRVPYKSKPRQRADIADAPAADIADATAATLELTGAQARVGFVALPGASPPRYGRPAFRSVARPPSVPEPANVLEEARVEDEPSSLSSSFKRHPLPTRSSPGASPQSATAAVAAATAATAAATATIAAALTAGRPTDLDFHTMVHGAPATKDGRGVARLNVKEFFLGETIVNIRGSLSSLAKFPTRHEIMTYHGPEVTGPRPSLAPPAPRAPTAANAVPYGGQGREQRKEVRRRQLMASHKGRADAGAIAMARQRAQDALAAATGKGKYTDEQLFAAAEKHLKKLMLRSGEDWVE